MATQVLEKEMLSELEDFTELGRQLHRKISRLNKPKVLTYFSTGLDYIGVALQELLGDKPSALIDVWAKDFRKALQAVKGQKEKIAIREAGIIALSPETAQKILTPQRRRLISILLEKQVDSVSELARLSERPIETVSRDLKILHNFGFIHYDRHGKQKMPILVRHHIFIELKHSAKEKVRARR